MLDTGATHYECGCILVGHPDDHYHRCQLHKTPWVRRVYPDNTGWDRYNDQTYGRIKVAWGTMKGWIGSNET